MWNLFPSFVGLQVWNQMRNQVRTCLNSLQHDGRTYYFLIEGFEVLIFSPCGHLLRSGYKSSWNYVTNCKKINSWMTKPFCNQWCFTSQMQRLSVFISVFCLKIYEVFIQKPVNVPKILCTVAVWKCLQVQPQQDLENEGGCFMPSCRQLTGPETLDFRPFLSTQYLKNVFRYFLLIWLKCPLGLKDGLIEFWRP